MLHKQHNSVITLAVLLTLVGVSKPTKAFLTAQSDTAPTAFTVPEKLPQDAKVQIASSNSTASINQSLKESFTAKYPEAEINIETQDSETALKSLSEGNADLVAIGRSLTAAEKDQGFVEVPVSREKIAIVVSKDSPFDGNLTISQFAQIFRGEITDWSDLGGSPGPVRLVDLPDTNDTRQAFPNYPVFEGGLTTGSDAIKLDQDSTEEMISQLGDNGIGYAVANDVIDRDDVKIVTMHETKPDDPRYPFSQPFSLVYQGTPSEASQAFLGFATTEEVEQQVFAKRVGSIATVATGAIANSGLGNKAPDETSDVPSTSQADADDPTGEDSAKVDGDDSTIKADANNAEGSGELNPDVEGSGELNPDVESSGAFNPDVEGSGELNPDVEGSGAFNPDLEGSGERNPNVEGDSESNTGNNLKDDPTEEDTVKADGDDAAVGDDPTEEDTAKADGDDIAAGDVGNEPTGDGTIKADANNLEESGKVNPTGEGTGELNTENNLKVDGETNTGGATQGEVAPVPGETDGNSQNVAVSAEKGKWWLWWLPLLLLPLGGLGLFLFGRGEKSDQEPAISHIPNPDDPEGGATLTGDLGNVAANAVGTTSKLGGTAIATGGAAMAGSAAAAANFVGGKKSTEDDINFDRVELDTETSNINLTDQPEAEENNPVIEIPSNPPVNEFTGQKTKLQASDQPTKIQNDVVDGIDDAGSGLLDNLSQAGGTAMAGGAAIAGGAAAAASGFLRNREDSSEETAETSVDLNNTLEGSLQNPNITDQGFSETITESSEVTETDGEAEARVAKEFSGDFVLNEEATNKFTSEVKTTDTGIDSSNSDVSSATNWTEVTENISNDVSSATNWTEVTENTSNDVSSATNWTEVTENTSNDVTSATNWTEVTENISNGGSSATNWTEVTENTSNVVSDSVDKVTTNIPEIELSSNEETVTEQASSFIDQASQTGGAALAGGAAVLGGAAAAASGLFTNQDSEQTTTESSALDDSDVSVETTTSNDFDFASNVVADVETTSVDSDINLDEISFDGTDNSVNASLDEISFDDTDNSVKTSLDEISFDDTDNSVNASLDEISFDDTDNSTDLNLDEITFDDPERNSTSDLLSNNMAQITTDLSDDKSDDISNISTWLDSLETPNQGSEDISEWLDQLNVSDSNPVGEDSNAKKVMESKDNPEDISFQFLEDLLERDPNANQDDK